MTEPRRDQDALPRLLTIMGSGETSPTMVKTHRQLIGRLGPPPVPAVLLDTPFGFQENADDISARAQEYFDKSVGVSLEVASWRSTHQDALQRETALARLRSARYVFAGPGSPSYALNQWVGSVVPGLLADKLQVGATGGAITFASAAALTLGVSTVPVYEVYKVGLAPHWLNGLDLLAQAGLRAAVIPHFNNAEGGNHDTRFCYLGERRLAAIEAELPEGAFVLGVDEHTGCVLDLDAGTATVVGLGVVTVRSHGRAVQIQSGQSVPIPRLGELANELATGGAAVAPVASSGGTADGGRSPAEELAGAGSADAKTSPGALVSSAGSRESPLMAAVRDYEAAFSQALDSRDVRAAARTILEFDDELAAWSGDTLQSDQADQGRAVLRSMVVRLGQLAEVGARDPRSVLAPFVEALLDVRTGARKDKRWTDADTVRDRLVALGIEVRDTPSGTEWDLAGSGSDAS